MLSRRPKERVWRERPVRTGRSDRPIIQLPSVALRAAMVVGMAVVLIGVIVFRLWFLQILSGSQYVAEANDNRLRTIKIVAPRGVIVDRNGQTIVDNRPGLSIGIRPMDIPPGQRADVVQRLAKALNMPSSRIRQRLDEHAGYRYDLVIIKDDVSQRMVSVVREHQPSFPGVEVRQSYLRNYPLKTVAAHILGNLGEISETQLKEAKYRGYQPGDVIGTGGVEDTYDRWLRGKDGSLRIEVDAAGNPKTDTPAVGGRIPQPGDNLVLTIDSKTQKAAEAAILYGIDLAHHTEGGAAANAGAAVVLDARNGEVIAMASYPTFDPAKWVGGVSQSYLDALSKKSANYPLFNRADQESVAVGSTFKAIDAVAGLVEGVINTSTTFVCTGTYKPPNTRDKATWPCWLPTGHGAVALRQALTVSCDVFFYNLGYGFYERDGTPLADWAHRLGLGQTTGLDIAGEDPGQVPTPEWKRQTFTTALDKIWNPGDSINMAIGQGNLEATPLQMAVAYAAIANGGYVVQPHLGMKIVDAQGKLVKQLEADKPKKLDIPSQYLATIRDALRNAASGVGGTSTAVFGNYPIAVAGKTGTAEVHGKGDYSWYLSYAPANNPKYVVAVMIEQGAHGGTAAAPAARRIYDALFDKHTGNVTVTTKTD